MKALHEALVLTPAQAAERLNLSKATIRAWIFQRRMNYIKLGRAVRIPVEEIERLLADGYVPPIARPARDTNRPV